MTAIVHSAQLLKVLSSCFNDTETSDIQVHLKDNQVVHCHRFVLRLWSDVWAAALQDAKEASLDLTSHDASIVEQCLKYCYTSSIELNDGNLTRVHLFAHQYNLKDLQVACEQELLRTLSVENCFSRYRYLFQHEFSNLQQIRTRVREVVCDGFVAASKTEGFRRLPEETLCTLLEQDELMASEDEVLDACCLWLGDSPDPQVRERVLKLVRFLQLSAKKLMEFRSHKLFQPDLESRYAFAMEWMLAGQLGVDRGPLLKRLTTRSDLLPRANVPWSCPHCHAPSNLPSLQVCSTCKRRNYARGIAWTVLKFDWAQVKNEHKVESELFDLAGHRWRMLLFPRGLDGKSSVSPFLNVQDLTDSGEFSCEFFVRVVYPTELNSVKGAAGEKSRMFNDHFVFSVEQGDRGVDGWLAPAEVGQFLANGQLIFQVGVAPKKRAVQT